MNTINQEILNKINDVGVSIVIGARNEYPQVAMTIANLMENMYASGITKWEILLCDNGSEDETSRFFAWKPVNKGTGGNYAHLGSRWAYEYSPRGLVNEDRLRIFFDPVLSNVGTRNKGVEKARYQIIIFSDAHIIVRSDAVYYMAESLLKFGGVIHGAISWMGASCDNPQAGLQYTYKVGEKIWGCVDEKTEVLTEDGWKKYNEFKKGTRIPTLNLRTNKIEMQTAEDFVVWDYDGNLVRVEGRDIDMLMTPDHRCIYRDGGSLKIKHAKDLDKDVLVVGGGSWEGKKKVYDDALVEVLGWVTTEGNYYNDTVRFDRGIGKKGKPLKYEYTYPRVQIIQKKHVAEIEDCLKRANLGFFKMLRKDGVTVFRLSRKSSYKIIDILPSKELTFDFLFNLTIEQLPILYKSLVLGDSHTDKTGHSCFIQVSNQTTDVFQALCTLMGRNSRTTTRQAFEFGKGRFGKKPINNVSVKINKLTSTYKKKEEYYKGKVWCPNVKNGTIFIRRNGKIVPTGNTWIKTKVAETAFYIPLCGHAFMGVLKDEFLAKRGYPLAQRVYGGGEPYLDTKYWMTGSTSMMEPRALVYHLSAGRGYSWNNQDLIYNMLLVSYILGGEEWIDRIYITYLNKHGANEPFMTFLYNQAKKDGQEDKDWLDEHKIMTFEELLALDKPNDCTVCTKRGYADPHPMRIWDVKNEELHGYHRSFVQEFKLWRNDEGNVFIGQTPITDPFALEIAKRYV